MERIEIISWESVSLVVAEKQDLAVMYRWANNINITKYWWSISHKTLLNEEKFIEEILTSNRIFFMIMDKNTRNIIWSVGFHKFDELSRNWLLWISIYDEKNLWKGFWTAGLKLFLKYVFEIIWVNKVKLNVFSNNPRAIKCYENCWFKQTWVLREEVYVMWKYEDSICMEILASEYFLK